MTEIEEGATQKRKASPLARGPEDAIAKEGQVRRGPYPMRQRMVQKLATDMLVKAKRSCRRGWY